MLCGSVLSQLECDSTFDLSAPQIVSDVPSETGLASEAYRRAFQLETGGIALCLELFPEHAAVGRRIRVLIVNDSAIVRKILSDALADEADIEVVGSAPDPYVARDKILSLQPDVLTLDIEMPRMDGLTFLKKLMHYRPMPVIVISSLGQSGCRAALEAVERGAVEVLAKPGGPYSVGELRINLANKIRAAAAARKSRPAPLLVEKPLLQPVHEVDPSPSSIVAIGASTGGTEAIQQILLQMPERCPPLVITQHIPAGFSRAFADRLNQICRISVREAAGWRPRGNWSGAGGSGQHAYAAAALR